MTTISTIPNGTDFLAMSKKLKFGEMLLLLFLGIVLGSALGAITNLVNGLVSPKFFRDVMGWYSETNIWAASIRQGILEGAGYGLFFGTMFLALLVAISHRRVRLQVALRYVVISLLAALVMWVIGGLIGILYVCQFPNSYSHRFFGRHALWETLAAYAWVRGSIWGIVLGGPFAVVVGIALYAVRYTPGANRL